MLNFRECPKGEVRRTPIPRRWMTRSGQDSSPIHSGLLQCLVGPGTGVRIIGDTRRTGMNRRRLWAAGVVLVLLVVGAGVVLAGGAGYAEDNGDNGDENAGAKCSEATLQETYLFAHDGVDISGNDQAPFANAGYDVFDGNGKVDTVFSGNANGHISRKEHASSTYTVKADCTGTITSADGSQSDLFIAPDGSMFTFVQTDPSTVTSGFELQGTAKRVGD